MREGIFIGLGIFKLLIRFQSTLSVSTEPAGSEHIFGDFFKTILSCEKGLGNCETECLDVTE
jgi:hypothetical protein